MSQNFMLRFIPLADLILQNSFLQLVSSNNGAHQFRDCWHSYTPKWRVPSPVLALEINSLEQSCRFAYFVAASKDNRNSSHTFLLDRSRECYLGSLFIVMLRVFWCMEDAIYRYLGTVILDFTLVRIYRYLQFHFASAVMRTQFWA